MTRKDYVLVAAKLNGALSRLDEEERDGFKIAVGLVADAFAEDNARFDRLRFLDAAGVR